MTVEAHTRRGVRRAQTRTAKYRELVANIFAPAGIAINGDRACDIRVLNDGFYKRLLVSGSLGLGDAYVDGWWEADHVDEVMSRFARANLHRKPISDVRLFFDVARARMSRSGAASKAFEVAERHYDLGNDLFEVMLDRRMTYSCAYWKGARTLDEAQENKLDLVCRKLGLQPGMRVLEIGCGWGSWAKFAAQRYGVHVVGLTISKEQAVYARRHCAGLPIDIRLQDYRDVHEQFDRVVSIGMFEHVGHRYYRTFMNVVERCLTNGGVFLLHTIVGNEPLTATEIPWITKHIFPNGEIPSLQQIFAAARRTLVVEAMQRFGSDYETTLAAWYDNFVAHWPQIESSYGKRFFRMWTFYLLMARGFFAAKEIAVWQIIYSKNGTTSPPARPRGVCEAFDAR